VTFDISFKKHIYFLRYICGTLTISTESRVP
jgi:hypothetical protein